MSTDSDSYIDKSDYPDPDIRGLSLLDSDSEQSSLEDFDLARNSDSTTLGSTFSEYGSDSSLHISDSFSAYLEGLDPNDPTFLEFQANLENPWSDFSEEQMDHMTNISDDSSTNSLPSRFTISSSDSVPDEQ